MPNKTILCMKHVVGVHQSEEPCAGINAKTHRYWVFTAEDCFEISASDHDRLLRALELGSQTVALSDFVPGMPDEWNEAIRKSFNAPRSKPA